MTFFSPQNGVMSTPFAGSTTAMMRGRVAQLQFGRKQCSREAARALYKRLQTDNRFITPFAPELDILIFALRADTVSATSLLSRRIFDAAAQRDLHLALADLPLHLFQNLPLNMKRDRDTITCLRSVLMKPAHFDWVDQIWERILASVGDVENRKNANFTP